VSREERKVGENERKKWKRERKGRGEKEKGVREKYGKSVSREERKEVKV